MFCSTLRSGISDSSWKTAAMPAALAASGLGRAVGRAVEEDLAGVVADGAGEDLDQRGFAGAVLAEEGVDLAGAGGEAGVAEGDDAAEALGEPGDFDQILARARPLGSPRPDGRGEVRVRRSAGAGGFGRR